MLICPVCKTEAKDKNQEYCLNCAWEFEYFFNELSQEEKERYNHKLKIHKSIYNKSLNSLNSLNIEKVKQKNYNAKKDYIIIFFAIFTFISILFILIYKL
jgi:hypothetical protein